MALDTIITKWEIDTKDAQEEQKKIQKGFKKTEKEGKKASKGISDSFKGLGTVLAGAFAFTAIIAGLTKVISLNAELSDSIADVRKTTGLTKEGVEALVVSLKKIDTRTSLKGLLEISKIGGQIGVAKDEIFGFTNAIDKAVVALGDEFGGGAEQVATTLGKIESVFNISKESGDDLGVSLTKIGSAINALGAAGLATAPFLTDFTQRLGGIAVSAGISATEIFGLAAAVEQSGLRVESSSTAISSLLQKFSTDTAKFAKLAGVGVEEFTELVNTDLNEALLLFLEGTKNSAKDTITFAKNLQSLGLEGAEVVKVVSTLSGKTDLIREKQALANIEFEKGTSLLEEFNLKNNTLAANIDKLFKRISGGVTDSEFADFLNDIVIGIVDIIDHSDPVIEAFSEIFNLVGDLANELLTLAEELGLVDEQTDKTGSVMEGLGTVIRFVTVPLRLIIKGFTLLVKGLISVKDTLIPVVEVVKDLTTGLINLINDGLSKIGIGAKEAGEAQKDLAKDTKIVTDAVKDEIDASKELEKQDKKRFKAIIILSDKEKAAAEKAAKARERQAKKEAADAERLAKLKLKIQEQLTRLSLEAIEDETERKLALLSFAEDQDIEKLREKLEKQLISQQEFEDARGDIQILTAREIDSILEDQAKKSQEEKVKSQEEADEKEIDAEKKKAELIKQIREDLVKASIDLLSIFINAQIAAIEREQEEISNQAILAEESETERVDALLENESLTEDQRAAIKKQSEENIQKIREDAEEKQKTLQVKRLKRERLAGLFEIAVNQAIAISELVKNSLKLTNPFAIAAAFAAGLALIISGISQAQGVINATRIPEFAEGGLISGDKKVIQVNEKGEEFMVNAKDTAKHLPVLEAMNAGNFDDYIVKTRVMPMMNEANKRMKKKEGQFMAESFANSFVNNSDFDDTNMLHEMKKFNYNIKKYSTMTAEAVKEGQKDAMLKRQRTW